MKNRSNTQESLAGRVAVVTGASRGIGLAIARALAANACSVVITGRSAATLDEARKHVVAALRDAAERRRERFRRQGRTVPELEEVAPGDPEFALHELAYYRYTCDVRSEAGVRGLFRFVKRKLGHVDILFNNAGTAHAMRNIEDMPLAIWREVLDTNLTGTFLCTRAALPLMSPGGVIVNNLSVAARGVFPGESAYCASKHGALGFTDTLREEVRRRGIRVISLLPGPTATDIWDQFMPQAPRGKMLSPETVAGAVVSAIALPENAAVEELRIGPVAGNL